MKYMVIARVCGKDYLTKVEAESPLSAEYLILNEGVCTKFGYGVDASMAYDEKSMKTDCFIGSALGAEPISYLDLVDIIHRHNNNLKEKVAAEARITEIEKEMELLAQELEDAKNILKA